MPSGAVHTNNPECNSCYDKYEGSRGNRPHLLGCEVDTKRKRPDQEQLWLILGDGVNQAADLASGATSIPSWNLTPWMTFGNWF
jgi:hypothetical protein